MDDENQESIFRRVSINEDKNNNNDIMIEVKEELEYNDNCPQVKIPKLRTPIKLQKDLMKCSEQTTTRPQVSV